MLRGIYAPTDLSSIDRAPGLSPEQKLSDIYRSPVSAKRAPSGLFTVTLPWTKGACFGLRRLASENAGYIHFEGFNVGDKTLLEKGIGTRLLKAALALALSVDPSIDSLSAQGVRLGMVNTVVATLGKDSVCVNRGPEKYGMGQLKSLDDLFDDFPPIDGKPYKVHGLTANIAEGITDGFEIPVLDF